MRQRIFVDVTRTAGAPHHTGIQKVVRGLFRALEQRAEADDLEIVPVVLTGRGAVALPGLAPHPFELAGGAHRRPLRAALARIRDALRARARRLRRALVDREADSVAARLLLRLARPLLAAARAGRAPAMPGQPVVSFKTGDVLVMPDSSWLIDPWPTVAQLRAAGGRLVSVWYDLIPLQYPEHFDSELVGRFRDYFERLLAEADDMVAISRTVREEIADHASRRGLRTPRLHHAWPGVELAPVPARGRADLVRILARPTILMVATLEPRKGHALLLDACERLWERGVDANCLLVGRVGWNVESLMARLRVHPERGRRLFHLADASDEDVAFAYARASVTAYPSAAEGLGLPLVEAEIAGCPVVCTDIPVFREVASPATTLFSPRTAEALADALASRVEPPDPARRAEIAAGRRGLGSDAYAGRLLRILRTAPKPPGAAMAGGGGPESLVS